MNKTLWKLDRISGRLRSLATLSATQAAGLANDGKGVAVVAEETRKVANKLAGAVEKAAFENIDIDEKQMADIALFLNLLALNSAVEAHHLGHLGKGAAVCAEEVRGVAYEVSCLFDKEAESKAKQFVHPWPKDPLTSIGTSEFLHLDIGGINVLENLANIKEICANIENNGGVVNIRGMELPHVDCYKMMGKTQSATSHVVLYTPWAGQNKTYAVAADVKGIHLSAVGRPMPAPNVMPLAKNVRECWENESGDMFYFMDWPNMV